MRTLLFKWLTAVLAVMLVSSFVSMMAAFVGSEREDLRNLLVLQVSAAGSGFVAVGAHEGRGAIYTSEDGVTWVRVDTPVPGWLSDVTANSSQIVAVGRNGLAMVMAHGEWAVQNASTKANLHGVTWTGNDLTAVGGQTTTAIPAIVQSADGINWQEGLGTAVIWRQRKMV